MHPPSTMSALATAGLIGTIGVLAYRNVALLREVERQTQLRQTERQGRIRAETTPILTEHPDVGNAWTFHPIGTVRSVFAKRSGTPRQPGLVDSAESTIELVPELKQAIDGIGEFSHVWILFIFNQNTNIAKRLKAKHPFDGLKLMVEPPKAQGRKVGLLACRTPHRPNPIGLSLCRVVRLKKGALVVAGLDCLDGTPVIDIKPYLPIVESVPDATAPSWIYQGFDEDRVVTVRWGCDRRLPPASSANSLPEEQALRVIEQTLSRDIRSRNQIELGHQMQEDWVGELRVAELVVSYSVDKNKIVTILNVQPSP